MTPIPFDALLYAAIIFCCGAGIMTGFVIFMGERQERRKRNGTKSHHQHHQTR